MGKLRVIFQSKNMIIQEENLVFKINVYNPNINQYILEHIITASNVYITGCANINKIEGGIKDEGDCEVVSYALRQIGNFLNVSSIRLKITTIELLEQLIRDDFKVYTEDEGYLTTLESIDDVWNECSMGIFLLT